MDIISTVGMSVGHLHATDRKGFSLMQMSSAKIIPGVRMLIANQDIMSDRRRILTLRHLAPSVLMPSGHGLLRPVRPDCVWCSSITS